MKRDLFFQLSITRNFVVFCSKEFPLPLSALERLCSVLWHSLGLPYNYLESRIVRANFKDHRRFPLGNIVMVYTINGRGGHLSYVTYTIDIIFPLPKEAKMNFCSDWFSGSEIDV